MDATLQSTDKEASLKQQVLELHKKKVSGGGHMWLVVGGGREGVPARVDSLYFLGENSCP